ncbi:hypothetical protein B0I35DRAFT_412887 [Stachybotrys elegans]|uniref:Uncharacterized protein n=1 Tax=Stachybotrys elegans TaxID=80388 RepID=A0A8K0SLQ4_9HYPO|nr:hypothetical protein B0I35DRAFT_412887 [Stachybotrys elegans]
MAGHNAFGDEIRSWGAEEIIATQGAFLPTRPASPVDTSPNHQEICNFSAILMHKLFLLHSSRAARAYMFGSEADDMIPERKPASLILQIQEESERLLDLWEAPPTPSDHGDEDSSAAMAEREKRMELQMLENKFSIRSRLRQASATPQTPQTPWTASRNLLSPSPLSLDTAAVDTTQRFTSSGPTSLAFILNSTEPRGIPFHGHKRQRSSDAFEGGEGEQGLASPRPKRM